MTRAAAWVLATASKLPFREIGRDCPHRLRCLRKDEEGVSAIEFGLIAPLLIFALLAMTDVGFALYDRMTMDHVLRAGAQPAMLDRGEAAVLTVLSATASKNYTLAAPGTTGGTETIGLDVNRFCTCPSTGAIDDTCTSTCDVDPTIFYRLSATKSYDGIFMPVFDFAPSVLVQVR